MVYCPELARELEEKRQQKREQQERFRREAEERRASPPRPLSIDIGGRLNNRTGRRSMGRNSDTFTPQKPDE